MWIVLTHKTSTVVCELRPDLLTGDEWRSDECVSACTISDVNIAGDSTADTSSMHSSKYVSWFQDLII